MLKANLNGVDLEFKVPNIEIEWNGLACKSFRLSF